MHCQYLMTIFERARKFALPAGEYALFGSALLDVWGIRPAADLDLIVTPELFAKLEADGWKAWVTQMGHPILTRDDADATTYQEHDPRIGYNPDRARLIREAVLIEGVPFVRIEEVIACKRDYDRPKDRDDLAAIARHLAGRAGEGIYQAAA